MRPTEAQKWRYERLHSPLPPNAAYEALPLDPGLLEDDVETIYGQQYLSPRPKTISARIGTDGYSPWTFTFWKNPPPEIHLERRGEVRTHDGIPLLVREDDRNIAFVSRWDNFPTSVELPIGKGAHTAVIHLCGTTNPMQCGTENARLVFRYEDGLEESVGLKNPDEFWSLCPLYANPSAELQDTCNDYSYDADAFCLPETPPETLNLGENCRSVVLRWRLRESVRLDTIELEALSQEVVIGVLGVTLVI